VAIGKVGGFAFLSNYEVGRNAIFELLSSLDFINKSIWDDENFTSRNRLGEIDILKVSSRPDEEMKKSGFRTTYSRYHTLKN